MKLAKLLFVMSFCLLLAGCNNEFAKQEYHSDEKISQESERYAKTGSTFSQTSDGISFTADKFDGREKL
ncbi:MAG: hypothetical protein GX567_07035, partial [Clostridia bacterium]|nr:hypothetical protein [Clostridia bacterium]